MPGTENKTHNGDRFSPCLLSRLIDSEPQMKTERAQLAVTAEQLKQDVLRNLEIIFNSRSRLSDAELSRSESVTASVLGFGLSDFCGLSMDADARDRLKDAVFRQIRDFEPRIRRESLEVTVLPGNGSAKELEFLISGIIFAAPLKEEILFTSKLDLETGGVSISPQKARTAL